jgi:hypothetical protein
MILRHVILKKIIAVFIFILTIGTTRSQVLISILLGDKLNTGQMTFGLSLGNAWNSLSDYSKADAQSNFNLGLFLTLKLKERMFLQFDALAKYKLGAKGLPVYPLNDPTLDTIYQHGSLRRSVSCLGLNVSLQYRIWKYLNVEFGPQGAILVKTKDVFEADRGEGELLYEQEVPDKSSAMDFGISGGLSWQFNKGAGVKLGTRYYAGLTDMFPDDEGTNSPRSFQINVYIPIGQEKAKKKQK